MLPLSLDCSLLSANDTPHCLPRTEKLFAWRFSILCAHFVCQHLSHIQEENSQYKVIEKLRAIGCEFGPCLNAYTGIEETVYEFLVPTDDQEVLPQVLAIVAEFAFKIRSAPIWQPSCAARPNHHTMQACGTADVHVLC